MAKLENVQCYYTGGGIFCATAKCGDVYIATDFMNYGVYDVPYDDIENKHNYDYESHSVDPKTCDLPTWRELLTAIQLDGGEYYDSSFYPEIEKTVLQYFKSLDARIDAEDPGPGPTVFPLPREERLELIAPIIEMFEDFLDDKGIVIENDEKAESESPANIYGTDWGNLCDRIESYLVKLGVLKGEE